ncbi:hypothetical protein LCGC14_2191700, partial [marine sediment metagenome]
MWGWIPSRRRSRRQRRDYWSRVSRGSDALPRSGGWRTLAAGAIVISILALAVWLAGAFGGAYA